MSQTFSIVDNGQVRDMTEAEIAYFSSLEESNETDAIRFDNSDFRVMDYEH